jgi:hypothetical protein
MLGGESSRLSYLGMDFEITDAGTCIDIVLKARNSSGNSAIRHYY